MFRKPRRQVCTTNSKSFILGKEKGRSQPGLTPAWAQQERQRLTTLPLVQAGVIAHGRCFILLLREKGEATAGLIQARRRNIHVHLPEKSP